MLNTAYVKVGAFVLFIAVVAGYLIITFGGEGLGANYKKYYVYFEDAGGLTKGADVQVKGVKAGKVGDITIDKNGRIKVELLIDEKFSLYRNAKVYIRTLGLMGDKYVYVDPGNNKYGKLKEGKPIGEGKTYAGVEETFNNINRAIEEGDLKDLIISIRLLAKHIDQLVQENRRDVRETVANLRAITESLRKSIPRIADRIDKVAANLEQITGENKRDIREIVKNLRQLSADLRRKTPPLMDNIDETVSEFKGILKENRKDLHLALVNVKNSTRRLDSILTKIDEGKGTLGKLVNQDDLYKDVKEAINSFGEPFKIVKKSNLDIKMYAEKHTGNEDDKAGIAGIFSSRNDRYIYFGVISNSNGKVSKTEEIYQNGRTTSYTKRDYGILFDIQYARKVYQIDDDKSLWIRGGLKDSGGDIGIDLVLNDNMVVKTDLYNFSRKYGMNEPDKPQLDIVLNYKLKNYPIFIGVGGSDLLNDDYRGVYIGGGFLFRDNDLKYLVGSLPKP